MIAIPGMTNELMFNSESCVRSRSGAEVHVIIPREIIGGELFEERS